MITVAVNQDKHQLSPASSLSELIEALAIETAGIAVAINQQVIRKTDWATAILEDGDDVLIIRSTQGG